MRIRDPGWENFGSGMEKSRIQNPGIPDPQHCIFNSVEKLGCLT
jgi:hypothetical protein